MSDLSDLKYAIRRNTPDLWALACKRARDLNTIPDIGASLVGYAAILNADAIPVLVDAGANVRSAADASGRTPLELAERHNNVDAIIALIAVGADEYVLKKRGVREAAMMAYDAWASEQVLDSISTPLRDGPVWVRVVR